MSGPLLSNDIVNLRTSAESCFFDECRIAARTVEQSGSGEEIPGAKDWGDPIPCSFDVRAGSRTSGAEHTLLTYDATVRLPAGTIVDAAGFVKATKRFGEPVDGPEYAVMSPPQEGPSATRVLLKRVET